MWGATSGDAQERSRTTGENEVVDTTKSYRRRLREGAVAEVEGVGAGAESERA